MPPVSWGAHLIEWMFEVGPVLSDSMGLSPLSDRDMRAWQDNQGISLTGWECATIIRLSRIYCAGLATYKDEAVAPPWAPITQPNVKAIDAWTEMLKSHAKKR